MSKPEVDKNPVGAVQFNGDSLRFAVWKSKVIIHLRSNSEQKKLEKITAKRKKTLTRYEDLLESQPELPPGPFAKDKYATWQHDMHEAMLENQASYIKRLLSQTLPSSFKGIDAQKDEHVHAIWRRVEKQYGLSNAAGVVGLVRNFDTIVNSDFKSMQQLLQELDAVRKQVNANGNEALQTGLISSEMMLVKVLGVLPKHFWGSEIKFTPEGFTLKMLSDKLSAIFGTNIKAEILALGRETPVNHVKGAPVKPNATVLGKRKYTDRPVHDVHHNSSVIKCHYCGGHHNGMNNIGSHINIECPKRALDQSAKVFRCSIWSRPTRQARKEAAYEPTPKIKGKGKIRTPARREIPLDECLTDRVAVDACEAVQEMPKSPVGYTSPPPCNVKIPLTPGRDICVFDDEDEPMDSVVNAVNVNAEPTVNASGQQSDGDIDMDAEIEKGSKQEIAATTEQFDGMINELDDKGADTA